MFDVATSHPYSNNLPAISDLTTGHVIQYPFLKTTECGTQAKLMRPCVVFDTETHGTQIRALIAPGTTEFTGRKGGYDVDVNLPLEMLKAGLDHTTRFLGAERLQVALLWQATDVSPGITTEITGKLTGASLARLNAIRGRIHAEADIAAAIAAGTF